MSLARSTIGLGLGYLFERESIFEVKCESQMISDATGWNILNV
jgi:hypothetical protein